MKKVIIFILLVLTVLLSAQFVSAQAGGTALEFVGSGGAEYIVIADNPAFIMSAVTIEFWLYKPVASSDVEFLTAKAMEHLEIHLGGGVTDFNKIRFIPTNGLYIDTPINAFLPGQWNHIACVYDPAGVGAIYVNGVDANAVVTNGSIGAPLISDALGFYLGMRADTFFPLNGRMDEVRIWNYARSAAEINATMNTGIVGPMPGLVAVWNFDTIADDPIISGSTIIPDVTTNGLNGIAYGDFMAVPSNAGISSATWTIPTVGEWAMIILTLAMLIGATVMIRHRQYVTV